MYNIIISWTAMQFFSFFFFHSSRLLWFISSEIALGNVKGKMENLVFLKDYLQYLCDKSDFGKTHKLRELY